MKRKIIVRLLLLAIITITLYSCVQDYSIDQTNTIEVQPLESAKLYSKNKALLYKKNMEWNNARIFEHEDHVVLISVPIKNTVGNLVEEVTFKIDKGKMTGHLWKFESIIEFSPNDYILSAHEIMKKMIGTVSYSSLEGSSTFEYKVVRGEIINNTTSKGGPGDINNPTCNACHMAEIEPVVIPTPTPPTPPWTPPTFPPLPPVVVLPPVDPQQDPCTKALQGSTKASDFGQNPKFSNAKQGILNAFAQNGGENGVGFGSNISNGPIDATGVQQLNPTQGTINNPYAYPTADFHNHPTNSPPSAGDVYSMMFYHNQNNSFQTRYIVTPNGTVYALVITNANAFADFLQQYPPQNTQYGPIFPTALNDEYNDIFTYYNGTQEMAMAYMLDKYNTGIALTKMDGSSNFKKLGTKETITADSTKSYTTNNCP